MGLIASYVTLKHESIATCHSPKRRACATLNLPNQFYMLSYNFENEVNA